MTPLVGTKPHRAFWVLVLLAGMSWFAQGADPPQLNGTIKSFLYGFEVPAWAEGSAQVGSSQGISQNRCRIDMLWSATSTISVDLAFDLVPTVRSGAGLDAFMPNTTAPPQYRWSDLRSNLYPNPTHPNDSLVVTQNLDRFSVNWSAPRFDLRLGRQAIAFGSARTVNPTDVLAPFRYEELDKEERTGVDAIRLRIPLGAMSELDSGVVFGRHGERAESAAFVRFRGYWKATDVCLIGMGFRENAMLGFDLSRSIGGAGFFLETAYTWDSQWSSNPRDDIHDYARLSIGFDTQVSDGFTVGIEYHFNGAGTTDPNNFSTQSIRTAYTEGGVFLLGKHFLTPNCTLEITPLWIFSFSALVNLSDPSALCSPSVEYNPKEDVILQLGAHLSVGPSYALAVDDPGATPTSGIHSEFGMVPDIFFASIRLYF